MDGSFLHIKIVMWHLNYGYQNKIASALMSLYKVNCWDIIQ